VKDSNFETVNSRDRDRSAAFKQLNPGDLFRWAAVPSHPPFEAPRDPPFGGWCERRDARTFPFERVLTPGVKQMLKRVCSPFSRDRTSNSHWSVRRSFCSVRPLCIGSLSS